MKPLFGSKDWVTVRGREGRVYSVTKFKDEAKPSRYCVEFPRKFERAGYRKAFAESELELYCRA